MRNFIILSCICCLFIGCYERQEGCLDIRAQNFDFGADKSCEDCCSYPKMKLSVSHEWGDTLLFLDSIYKNALGQRIRIIQSQFYLSNFTFTNDNAAYSIADSISVSDINGNTEFIRSDVVFAQTSRFNYTVGTFESADDFSGFSFRLGIDHELYNEKWEEDDLFFDKETYRYTNFRMQYVLEDVSPDTLTIDYEGKDNVVDFELNTDVSIPKGVDFTIGLVADYRALLYNMDLNSLSTSSGKSQLKERLRQFIR